jgi:hypothetical protein
MLKGVKKAWQNQNSTFDVKLYYQPLDQIFNIVCLYGLAQPFSKVVSKGCLYGLAQPFSKVVS